MTDESRFNLRNEEKSIIYHEIIYKNKSRPTIPKSMKEIILLREIISKIFLNPKIINQYLGTYQKLIETSASAGQHFETPQKVQPGLQKANTMGKHNLALVLNGLSSNTNNKIHMILNYYLAHNFHQTTIVRSSINHLLSKTSENMLGTEIGILVCCTCGY